MYGGYASIALDRSDNIHVIWPGYGQGLSDGWSNYWYRKKAGSWLAPKFITDQDVNDQWGASLLWANYPEVGGVKTNVLPGQQKAIWEDMGVAILFSETPVYAAAGGRSQAHVISSFVEGGAI